MSVWPIVELARSGSDSPAAALTLTPLLEAGVGECRFAAASLDSSSLTLVLRSAFVLRLSM